jgi:carboxylesterase
MRGIGEFLAGEGYSVLGVRLAGHATEPDDLKRVHWQDWLASVEDGYHLLRGLSKIIFIAGLSMGGVLTLLFSSRFPVSGLILMSTPFQVPPDPRIRYLKLFQYIIPKASKGKSDWHDLNPTEDHVHYPHYITRAVIEVVKLLDEMQSSLPKISAPALIVHSKDDQTVPIEHMRNIYTNIGSQDKEMIAIEKSGHVITRDAQKDQVFNLTGEFIKKVSSNQP